MQGGKHPQTAHLKGRQRLETVYLFYQWGRTDRPKIRINLTISFTIWNQWWCDFMRSESGSCHLEIHPTYWITMEKKGKDRIIHTQTPCWNLKVENFECPDFIYFPTLCFSVLIDLAKPKNQELGGCSKTMWTVHFEYISIKPLLNSIIQF